MLRFQINNDVVEVGYGEDFEIKSNNEFLDVVPNKLVKVSESLDVMRLSQYGKTTRVILHAIQMKIDIEIMKNRIRMTLPHFRDGKCRYYS